MFESLESQSTASAQHWHRMEGADARPEPRRLTERLFFNGQLTWTWVAESVWPLPSVGFYNSCCCCCCWFALISFSQSSLSLSFLFVSLSTDGQQTVAFSLPPMSTERRESGMVMCSSALLSPVRCWRSLSVNLPLLFSLHPVLRFQYPTTPSASQYLLPKYNCQPPSRLNFQSSSSRRGGGWIH